eukprot:UN15149
MQVPLTPTSLYSVVVSHPAESAVAPRMTNMMMTKIKPNSRENIQRVFIMMFHDLLFSDHGSEIRAES